VRTERCASSDIVEKLTFDAVDQAPLPTWPVACRKTPTVFSVADEIHWIADRILLLHKRRLPTILEVITVVLAHEFVANTAKVDPHMRKLIRKERPRVKQFTIVNVLPLV